jgi:cbb3-type cytochrome oxidase maturation protein
MTVVRVLIPLALLLGGGFTAAFVWSALSGQYDDLETPAHRILLEDDSWEKEDADRKK